MLDLKAVPKIIVIEGINGCGKTTFIQALQETMDQANLPNVIHTMAASGPLREEVLNNQDLTPIQRMMLFRVMSLTVQRDIKRSLSENKWVLLDRGWVTYQVYQGICCGLSHQQRMLEGILADPFPKADFTVFLDVGLELANQRMATRSAAPDFFENISRQFDEKAEEGFRYLINSEEADNRWRSNYITFYDELPPKLMANMAWDQIKQVILDDFEASRY